MTATRLRMPPLNSETRFSPSCANPSSESAAWICSSVTEAGAVRRTFRAAEKCSMSLSS